jgi:hypothetical protein
VIAPEACRYDVVPLLLTVSCDGYDVVERQVLGRILLPAVLTPVIISRVDIRSRKLYAVMVPHANVPQQPNNRRKLDRECDGVYFLIVLVNDLDLTCEQQRKSFFPRNDS